MIYARSGYMQQIHIKLEPIGNRCREYGIEIRLKLLPTF